MIFRRLLTRTFTLLLFLPTAMLLWAAEVDENVVWIDVRTAREFRLSHIEGAINIPHGDIGHKIFVAVPNTLVEVHLYDGSQGTFAGLALELLMEIGFQAVYNEGGYEQLLEQLSAKSSEKQAGQTAQAQ
ncbi:MAG: rhodanese-like domain-containing protein [Gammaproteobacteria bacterium]|nr:rhodanese-like domain-containing protein [Gammaproteobacteria bacterium]